MEDTELKEWQKYKFTEEEAFNWILASFFDPKNAYLWKSKHFTLAEAILFKSVGLDIDEATKWKDFMLKNSYFDDGLLEYWISYFHNFEKAEPWISREFTPVDAFYWFNWLNLDAEGAKKLIDQGLTFPQVQYYIDYGMDLDAIILWTEELKDYDLEPPTVVEYFQSGLTPEQVIESLITKQY